MFSTIDSMSPSMTAPSSGIEIHTKKWYQKMALILLCKEVIEPTASAVTCDKNDRICDIILQLYLSAWCQITPLTKTRTESENSIWPILGIPDLVLVHFGNSRFGPDGWSRHRLLCFITNTKRNTAGLSATWYLPSRDLGFLDLDHDLLRWKRSSTTFAVQNLFHLSWLPSSS